MSQTLYMLRVERRYARNADYPLAWHPEPKIGELVVVPSDKDAILKLAHEQLIDIVKGNEDILLDLKDFTKREPDTDSPSNVLYEVYFSSINDPVHPIVIHTISLVEVHPKQHS